MTRAGQLMHQFAAFGAVGLGGLFVDVVVFNFLRATVLAPDAVDGGVVIAKVISTTLAIAVNWVGNRYWSFARERTARPLYEFGGFIAVSAVTLVIPLGCLWVSHYVLGFTSPLADNISSQLVGLVLGAMVRFALYRTWVFTGRRNTPAPVTSIRTVGTQE